MADVVAKFSLRNENINANFDLNEGNVVDAIFKIDAAGTTWGSIDGDIANQTDLYNILNAKANQSELDSLSEAVSDNYTSLENEINGLSTVVDNNYSETVERFENDELAISNLTNTVSNNYIELSNRTLSNSTRISSISDTINSFGDIVTYNASNFATSAQGALANTALQPNDNISELVNNVGYITSASLPVVNNGALTIRANGETVGTFTANQAGDTTVEISIPDSATWGNITGNIQNQTDLVNALNDKQDNLTAQDGITLNNNIISGKPLEDAIGDIDELIPVQATAQNQLADKNFVNSSIATNTANFIGTFNSVAELEAYSGTLTNNDYAFVSTTDSAGNTLYDRYKWNGSEWLFEYELNNSSFTASQWASINSGITSGDVSLISTAIQPNDNISELTNDAGYITSASLPTVNNSNITLQKNGVDVGSFTLNQSSNGTINFSIPTDTSDLTNGAGFLTSITSSDVTTALGYTPYNSSNPNGYTSNVGTVTSVNNVQPVNGNVTISIPTVPTNISAFTNDSGYITSSALNGYATQRWVGEQGYITGISSTDVTTALGYTPYNSSNPNGYTSNVGTVTSVNNIQPDTNGNVTISTRNVGEVITSTLPLTDAGLHLLDGTLLQYGIYQEFIDYIADLYAENPTANYFTDETTWQNSVTQYGSCGKFVYDSTLNTVRLPKVTGIIEGTTDATALGDLVKAGLPNITGALSSLMWKSDDTPSSTGAFAESTYGTDIWNTGSGSLEIKLPVQVNFDASDANSIYGNSTTVQPQTIKAFYYIVIANSTKTDIQVDIDEIATDLNGKAETDLANVTDAGRVLMSGMGMPGTKAFNFTVGASGSNVTMPANGWLVMRGKASAANQFISLKVLNGSRYREDERRALEANNWITILFPVNAGDSITYYYTVEIFQFQLIYANGSESEAS